MDNVVLAYALLICVLVVSSTGVVFDKKVIQDLLASQCPRQCRSEVDIDYLKKMCTCIARERAFLYGKRTPSSSHLAEKPVVEDRNQLDKPITLQQLAALLAAESQQRKSNVANVNVHPKQDTGTSITELKRLEEALSAKERQTKRLSIEPMKMRDDSNSENLQYRAIQELLSATQMANIPNNKGKSISEIDQHAAVTEGTTDLFKAEIGKDEATATKEDYLNWVEKQMKVSELRLEKLLKFYEFIRLTKDM